jgi:hypothetical protein
VGENCDTINPTIKGELDVDVRLQIPTPDDVRCRWKKVLLPTFIENRPVPVCVPRKYGFWFDV